MVPCVEDGSKQYVCPRNGDALEETDGTGFRDWFNDQNRITKGNLKRTVVTVQTWWVELGEGGLPKAGAGGGGYVIYRAWILKWTSPPST